MMTADRTKRGEALAFSTRARDYVNSASALNVTTGVAIFGRPLGTVTQSALVESRAQWLTELDKLAADPAYVGLATSGAELFVDGTQDTLRQVLHLNGWAPGDPNPAVVQGWSAQIAKMQFDAAMAWAVAVSDHVASFTNVGVALLADNYGDFGTLTWLAAPRSAEQADAMNEAMLANDEWRKMLLDAADLYIDSSIKVWLNRILP